MKRDILICECHSTEHQIVIGKDEEDGVVYCHIHLSNRPWWKRLYYGIKFIFGYKCKYGHWDEFLFNPNDVDKLKEIVDLLEKHKE